jgi:hypothetical protein
MGGAVPPLPQYAFMEWCSVGSTGTTLPSPIIIIIIIIIIWIWWNAIWKNNMDLGMLTPLENESLKFKT